VEEHADHVLLRLDGDLDVGSAERFARLTEGLHEDARPLAIDASGLAFADSVGISRLCMLAMARRRPVGMLSPQYVVRNALLLMDLGALLPAIEALDEATLGRLGEGIPGREPAGEGD
jgi:anti-anti-sigma regulatory factor